MTTTRAVAVWNAGGSLGLSIIVAMFGLSIAGCSSTNLLGDGETSASISSAKPVAAPSAPVAQSKVALAPVVGAPEAVGKQLATQLGSTLERQRVAVAKAGERADYTLRGYVVAAKEKAGVKVSYIWDLTDPNGKRVNRIQGEEIAQGGDGKDPWSAVTPAVSQTIADKTGASLSTALSSLTPAVNNASAPVGVGAPTSATPPTETASLQTPVSTATTASIDTGNAASRTTATIVPEVTGAPGDGNGALSVAMRQELQQAGLAGAQPGQRGYTVAGKVTMSPVKDGKQSIKIDWRVADPAGATLATVTQNNEIAAGALDGTWGTIAQEAAQGAAVKIKTLIEENVASGGASAASTPVYRNKSVARSRT